ncbi:hypothetical protein VE00_10277 [Pseudogymnoascus sp. WSF 3629]|nr:hypothetical protein VE00_10277 [Pseudogymnoascus sp. WSF 3629]
MHRRTVREKGCEEGTFGTELYKGLEPDKSNGDIIVSKHRSWSSFENIDLEFRLRQRDINNLIIAGMETSACVESTARTARETTDATGVFTQEAKVATETFVWLIFANKITTVSDWVKSLA